MNLGAPVLNSAGLERFIKENNLSLLHHSSYFIVLPKVLHHLYKRSSRRLETPSLWFVFNIHWIEWRIRNVSFSPLITKRRKSMVGEVSQALEKSEKNAQSQRSGPETLKMLMKFNWLWKWNLRPWVFRWWYSTLNLSSQNVYERTTYF